MGKNLIQQARGKGGPTYTAPSFRYLGKAEHPGSEAVVGKVVDILHCAGHTAPLADLVYNNNRHGLIIASEGISVGESLSIGQGSEIRPGNVLCLSQIPDGTLINNIELVPGDGGKFVRSSGTFAKVLSKKSDSAIIMLPSKKTREFNLDCRASIGIVAGGGRTEKPFVKAGFMYYKAKATNRYYPRSSAAKMNAVDHPYGNKRSSRKSKARPVSRNAPPGRKVGMIAARRTGRKKK